MPKTPILAPSVRYHGFDFARAILMTLGIIYHSCLVFGQDGEWLVSSAQTSVLLNPIAGLLHLFRMEAFYIIAGFFFVLIIEKRGYSAGIKDRLFRIGIPLLAVGLLVNYPLIRDLANFRAMTLTEYSLHGGWLGHLWFIANLLIYYIISLPLIKWLNKDHINRMPLNRWTLSGLVGLSAVVSVVLQLISSRTLDGVFIIISFWNLAKYLPFFWLGMYLYKQRDQLIMAISYRNSIGFLAVFIAIQAVIHFLGHDLPSQINYALYCIGNGYLAITSICLLYQIGRKQNEWIDKITDASYTIYLLHFPFIIIYTKTVLPIVPLPWMLGFTLMCATTFFVTYYAHRWIVKKHRTAMWLLNGRALARK